VGAAGAGAAVGASAGALVAAGAAGVLPPHAASTLPAIEAPPAAPSARRYERRLRRLVRSSMASAPLLTRLYEHARFSLPGSIRSGALSSFVFRFGARRAPKRNTDKMASTMLPQATRCLRAAP